MAPATLAVVNDQAPSPARAALVQHLSQLSIARQATQRHAATLQELQHAKERVADAEQQAAAAEADIETKLKAWYDGPMDTPMPDLNTERQARLRAVNYLEEARRTLKNHEAALVDVRAKHAEASQREQAIAAETPRHVLAVLSESDTAVAERAQALLGDLAALIATRRGLVKMLHESGQHRDGDVLNFDVGNMLAAIRSTDAEPAAVLTQAALWLDHANALGNDPHAVLKE